MSDFFIPGDTKAGLEPFCLKPLEQHLRANSPSKKTKVFCIFGTRPEVIKLAPVIRALKEQSQDIEVKAVASGQHTDLLWPLLTLFELEPDFDLDIMQARQSPTDVCARVMQKLEPIIQSERPDLILVQGDTTTALAAALVGFHNKVPVGHVEAGLRSGDPLSPFPEEMNRRLITQVATFHFAATPRNCKTLLQEGVPEQNIFLTGNPVVDSLNFILKNSKPSARVQGLLQRVEGKKLIVLTTHRRESFGDTMRQNLNDIRHFVTAHDDLALVFAVHPNPNVKDAAREELENHPRILLIEPLDYADFVQLLRQSWLLLSDSGGIQEEAPTLGKPLFVLRNNTERPEAIESGVAFLVGDKKGHLASMLRRAYDDPAWLEQAKSAQNPFGDGSASNRITELVRRQFVRSGVATC